MTVADLSPDALAKLEAKLVADLDMVRKVRALLEEHQSSLGTLTAALPAVETPPAAAIVAAVASTVVTAPAVPRKPLNEIFMDCLIATGGRPFAPQDFKRAVYQVLKNAPDDSSVKSFFNQMIRQGKLVVHEFRKGRPGSLYRSRIPQPAAPETPPAESTESAEVPETASPQTP